MNDIFIQTGASSRAETDEPDAVNEAATWRARYEQAERRIAALEEELTESREAREWWIAEALRNMNERDTARRSAAARLRAVKRMKRVAQYWRAWGEEQFDAGFERAVQSEWGTTTP